MVFNEDAAAGLPINVRLVNSSDKTVSNDHRRAVVEECVCENGHDTDDLELTSNFSLGSDAISNLKIGDALRSRNRLGDLLTGTGYLLCASTHARRAAQMLQIMCPLETSRCLCTRVFVYSVVDSTFRPWASTNVRVQLTVSGSPGAWAR